MKRTKTLVIIGTFFIFFACQPENTSKEPIENPNKELVINFVNNFWNMEDLDAALEMLSPDFINYASSNNFQGKQYTKEEMKNGIMAFNKMMPDLNYEIEEVVTEGNQTFLTADATFTHTDSTFTRFGMAPPTGKRISYKIVMMYKVEDGKIISGFDLYDMYNRAKEMGMIQGVSN